VAVPAGTIAASVIITNRNGPKHIYGHVYGHGSQLQIAKKKSTALVA
jgi:hypothetical protein